MKRYTVEEPKSMTFEFNQMTDEKKHEVMNYYETHCCTFQGAVEAIMDKA